MSSHDKHEAPHQPAPARTPLTAHNYQSVIDQIISKAQADGLMDNLSGEGLPLNLEDDSSVPEEYRLGNRLLKTSGFAPLWIEAQRDIERARVELQEWLTDANRRWPRLTLPARSALKVGYHRKLDDIQRMIMNYNLTAPAGAPHLEGLRMADELAKLGR